MIDILPIIITFLVLVIGALICKYYGNKTDKNSSESPSIIENYYHKRKIEYYETCLRIIKKLPKEQIEKFRKMTGNPSEKILNGGAAYPALVYATLLITKNKE